MNRSYYEGNDDFGQPWPKQSRDRSPSGRVYPPAPMPPVPYASGALPPPFAQSQPRFHDGPRETSSMSLQVPSSRYRPRSVPPPATDLVRRRPRSRSSSRSSSSSIERSRTPVGKARHAIKDTFTDTRSGLGVGILGALVGGLVAREASDAAARARSGKEHDGRHSHRPESSKEHQKSRALATLAGAVAGGLGANAIEKRFEVARERDKRRQDEWEKKWGKESELPHYDSGKKSEEDHGYPRRGRRDERDDYEYVYEERRPRRRRSEEGYRYRY